MTLTITQFASLGGKARWKGIKAKDRSIIMSKVANSKNLQKRNKVNKAQNKVISSIKTEQVFDKSNSG